MKGDILKVIIDAANVAHFHKEEGAKAKLKNITLAVKALEEGGHDFLIIADASLRHNIDDKETFVRLVEDGIIDDTDGGVDGQYWWGGTVNNISPNGEWICGEHSYNGTGYADSELPSVGFRYNTKTKVFEDSLFGGIPFVIFDDGEMIFSTISNGIMSSSDDKSIYCGTYPTNAGFGNMSMPMIILNNVVAVENVEKLDVDMYVNNSVLVTKKASPMVMPFLLLSTL